MDRIGLLELLRSPSSAAEILVAGHARLADVFRRRRGAGAVERWAAKRVVQRRAQAAGVLGEAAVVAQVREGRFKIVGMWKPFIRTPILGRPT